MAPVDDLARAVRAESDALLLLDGVCSVGGAQVHMSAWGVDGVIACGQKALGGPPGLTVVQLAQRAVKCLEGAPQRGFYASLGRWLPVMRDPQRYFSTHTVPLVRGLRAAIDEVLAETMPARAARHRRLAERLRDGFRDLGFESAAAPGLEAPTVSALRYPAGVDDAQFRSRMLSRGITVAGALGDWAGSVVRVGHMANIDDTEVEQVLAAARAAVE
jgi:aspartate aminotransferase-like enzyme